MNAILVTIPKSTPYSDIKDEMLNALGDDNLVLNHKLGRYSPKLKTRYIYFVYCGEIRFMADLINYEEKEFKCTTTGVKWSKSYYAVFDGAVEIRKENRVNHKGFQGFKYIEVPLNKD